MDFKEYCEELKKAVASGESIILVINRHVNDMSMPLEITEHAQTFKKLSLFEKVVNFNIDFTNHESDLYIAVNDLTEQLIKNYEFEQNVTTFTSNFDCELTYDIPFAYDIFWKKKRA